MTLSRAILISLLAFASSFVFAAEPKSDALSAESSSRTATAELSSNLEVPHLVPWFTGVKQSNTAQNPDWRVLGRGNRTLLLPGTLGESTCFKLRAYKVERQERFREGESASLGYSTCQWGARFQIHSAVQTMEDPSH